MRGLRWALIVMTGVAIGVTWWEAAFGDRFGVIAIGLALSFAGVFLTALWQEER